MNNYVFNNSARQINHQSLTVVTPATTEPVTVDEVKLYARINTGTAEDSLIGSLITAARSFVETVTDIQLMTGEKYLLTLDRFPFYGTDQIIYLPMSPVTSIEWIKYYDPSNVLQTWASNQYQLDSKSEPARITPAFNCDYPETNDVLNAVQIQYVSGSGCPSTSKQSILMLASFLYEHRDETNIEIPLAIQSLIDCERIKTVF